MAKDDPELAGVKLSHLDQPVFDGAGVTKGDLVGYLDAVQERMLPELRDRALSVVRARPGQAPFMQKNLPKYAPDWILTTTVWANASKREVHYPVCNDRRTLVWLANQRAVEYHPALVRVDSWAQTHLILDLDPPDDVEPADGFRMAVAAALLVRQALADAGLSGGVKLSGAKGVHVFVPLTEGQEIPDVAAATRALAARAARLDEAVATTEFVREERGGKVFVDSTRAGGATVVAAYSPRARPGLPVSFPVIWDELEQVQPSDFTVLSAIERLGADSWASAMAEPQRLPDDLVAEGHEIPIARVVAMHEGKRRKREGSRRTS
ncbi:MAG TPA: ATP-dependent DNA ligase [Nocardioides sp.]|uniref:DNA polymerase domain-containing protein n=1 Tax=Nocardioides sp. TaxID=35761 RepID=UPI002E3294D0|nr:ATP-dependent DNA ligase [Nocardioides sp.]HEX5088711.1 ATP-dependent DNA ligase [Nocardioides sp.]